MDCHFDYVSSNKQFHRQQLGATLDKEFEQLLALFDCMLQHVILWAKDGNISSNKKFHHQQLGATLDEEFEQLLGLFDCMLQHAILWAKDCNISSWLEANLICQHKSWMVALCYKMPLLSLPSVYDGCGAPFSIEHALDCCFWGHDRL